MIDSLKDLACSEKLQEDSCQAIEEEEEEENVNQNEDSALLFKLIDKIPNPKKLQTP